MLLKLQIEIIVNKIKLYFSTLQTVKLLKYLMIIFHPNIRNVQKICFMLKVILQN